MRISLQAIVAMTEVPIRSQETQTKNKNIKTSNTNPNDYKSILFVLTSD